MRFVKYFRALMLVALAMAVASVSAANVDASAAQAKAIQFLNTQPSTRFMASPSTLKLAHAEPSSVDAKSSVFYVFNADDGGAFVIVSGDDRAEEILGYGDYMLDMSQMGPFSGQGVPQRQRVKKNFRHIKQHLSCSA